MNAVMTIAFVLLLLYAIFGILAVYVILARRGIPVRFFWVGTPGYLARVCSENPATTGPTLKWVARSTVVAFLAGMVLGVGLFGGR